MLSKYFSTDYLVFSACFQENDSVGIPVQRRESEVCCVNLNCELQSGSSLWSLGKALERKIFLYRDHFKLRLIPAFVTPGVSLNRPAIIRMEQTNIDTTQQTFLIIPLNILEGTISWNEAKSFMYSSILWAVSNLC